MKELASIWYESRYKAGKSQEYMAFELGVSRKTIQNWEKGTSSPSIDQAINWFRVLNISPLPYFYQYVYPSMENIKATDSDETIKKSLCLLLNEIPSEMVRELMFLFYGDHGSSPRGVLQLMTAHLQTPMRDRVSVASLVEKNYEIAKKKGSISSPNHIQPNIEFLKAAIKQGEDAFLKNKDTYVISEK